MGSDAPRFGPPARARRAVALLAGALLALGGCARGPRTPEPVSAQIDFADEVVARAPTILEGRQVPGFAVALIQDGRVGWTGGFGRADIARFERMRPTTVVPVGDLSQPLSAWGVWRLVEQGRLDPDAPVADSVLGWRLPRSAFDPAGVTARRLLAHTAGLSLRTLPPVATRPAAAATLPTLAQVLATTPEPGPAGGPSTRSGGGAGAGLRLAWAPGAGWHFSSGGYALLQLLVEERVKEAFPDYMRREVLQPLGMKASGFGWRREFRQHMATGYTRDGRTVPLLGHPAPAADGLYATVEDYARWVVAELPGRRAEGARHGVLNNATIYQLLMPIAGTRGPLGWWTAGGFRTDTLTNGVRFIAGGGIAPAPGFTTWFAAIPERGAGIVVFVNREDAWAAVTDLFCPWAEAAGGGTPASVCGI